MKSLHLQDIVKAVNGKVLSTKISEFYGVGTDSRKNLKDQLFIALEGEAFDAHDYLSQAEKAGAAALLIHQLKDEHKALLKTVTIIEVKDTLRALQDLGAWSRKQGQAQILALTGSNGKTTTKEFTAQIISTQKSVHYSQGSFNNHWGVPFSLLDLEKQHQVAVIEMGMNHAGEIQRLVEIADPDVVTCTMVGRAHIEFFGTQEKIAQAKQEIYLHSRNDSQALFNLDNPFTAQMYEAEKKRNPKRPCITFSEKSPADVKIQLLEASFEGLRLKGEIRGQAGEAFISVFGRQNITNLLAAASLALAAGLTPQQIWSGLSQCQSHWGRNQKVTLKSGASALFDAYNANPDSMEALLMNVKGLSAKRKIGVFGQMRELGELSQKFHEQLGEQVGQAGFAKVFFYGEDVESFNRGLKRSSYKGLAHTQKDFSDSLAHELSRNLTPGDFLVFKASRGLKLERMLMACEPLDFSLKA